MDGTGTIRARRRSEIAAGSLAAYDLMWSTGGTVVASINSDFGAQTIEIGLGPGLTITVSSSTFIVFQSLTSLHGNDFTALSH